MLLQSIAGVKRRYHGVVGNLSMETPASVSSSCNAMAFFVAFRRVRHCGILRLIMSGEYREVVHHATIGALVAVALAWSDDAVHAWFDTAFHEHPNWVQGLILVSILVSAFSIILAIESYWASQEKYNMERPHELAAVGVVDGVWLDAIWTKDREDPIEGTIVKITSSGRGFSVQGTSYLAADLCFTSDFSTVEPIGDFKGDGRPWSEDGLFYQYSGQETGKGLDRGVGFYRFWCDAIDPRLVRYDGAFLGLNIKDSRSVKGRMATETELADLNRGLAKQVLRSYLLGRLVR